MSISCIQRRRLAQIASVLLGAMCLTAFLLRHYVVGLVDSRFYPSCQFHQMTGYLCPACGNTRATLALLEGRPLRSLAYNPMILTLVLALFCLYLELLTIAFGRRHVRILPRSNVLLFITLGLVMGYDIFRNFVPALLAMY